jgi:hypothetical protein
MSKFLAPIHTWLFNKIKLYEGLESDLVNAYTEKYGENVKNLYKDIEEEHGYPLENKPIEELIDVSNIHGWLQHKISLAETRQAAFITEIFNNHNKEEALNIALDLYAKQARICAEEAKEKYQISTPEEMYNALNSYIIEGMPCDRVNDITVSNEDKLQWETALCLHKNYWDAANGDINVFYTLREAWIKAFIETLNSSFTYKVTHNATGTPISVNEITKK